jgi:hypothetical protein
VGRIRDACRDLEKNHSLYDLATKYDWDEYLVWDVLRGRRQPPVAMRRTIARELEIEDSYMQGT